MSDFIQNNKRAVKSPYLWIVPFLPPVLLVLMPVIYIILGIYITGDWLVLKEVVILFSLSIMLIGVYVAFYIFYHRKNRSIAKNIEEWFTFVNDYLNNTQDIFIILDNLGQILYYNRALNNALSINGNELTGRPFRNIFNINAVSDNVTYGQIILDKLREIFTGNETEIIAPVTGGDGDEYVSVNLKLIPIVKESELDKIYVTGRLIKNDYISSNWLTSERIKYVMNNNLSLVHMFCYRLTRNLANKLSPRDILFIQIAIQEVLVNAVEHGNLEIGYDKKTELKRVGGNYWELLCENCNSEYLEKRKVYRDYCLDDEKIIYTVRDDGRGFSWKQYIEDSEQPNISDVMVTFHGIGLQMVKKAFDEILFNEKGNEIKLIKYFNMDESQHDREVQKSGANS